MNTKTQYYDVSDVMRITGEKKTKSYDIIRKLRKQFKKKYPDSVDIIGKIPIWYFEKTMGNIEIKEGEYDVK